MSAQQCQAIYDGMEITQAIQHRDHPTEPDNSVPLVDGRATTARVYFTTSPPGCGPVPNVTGRLRVLDGTSILVDIRTPDNNTITVPPDPPGPNREAENDTLNFTFIPRMSSFPPPTGSRNLTFAFYQDGELIAQPVFTFSVLKCTPTFRAIPVNYLYPKRGDPTYGEPDRTLIAQGVGDDMLWAIWPFPEPRYGVSYNLVHRSAISLTLDINDLITFAGVRWLFRTMAGILATMSPQPDYFYAWFRDGAPSYDGMAAGIPSRLAFGNTYLRRYKRTYAHELGHNFGLGHNNSTIAPDVGWDVYRPAGRLGLGHVMPHTKYDIMVPGLLTDQAWIMADTYNAVLAAFNSTQGAVCKRPGVPRAVTQIPIGPDVDSIGHVFVITRDGWPTEPAQEGSGAIRLLDEQGAELYYTQFVPSVAYADSAGLPPVPLDTLVETPAFPTLHVIELYHDGQLKEVITRTANAPSVTITSPAPGETLDQNTVIAWQASDADGDPLRAHVQYSHDMGQRWITLAVDLQTSQLPLDPEWLPGGDNVRIRVIVSDGLNTTSEEVDDLKLELNHVPQVAIGQPDNAASYPAGANVMLLGWADDAEDGTLPDSSVAWYSSIDGFLGNGYVHNRTDLSAGTHVIEFRATDSDGATGSAEVTIHIQ